MVIVAAWCVEDYQVIRLAGSLTQRATRLAHDAGLDVAPLGKIPHLKNAGSAGHGHGLHRYSDRVY